MSTHIKRDNDNGPPGRRIVLEETRDGSAWVARDDKTGVASQGNSPEEAVAMLVEAVSLHEGEIGREPTDEELEEIGVDPEKNESGSIEDSDIFE